MELYYTMELYYFTILYYGKKNLCSDSVSLISSKARNENRKRMFSPIVQFLHTYATF